MTQYDIGDAPEFRHYVRDPDGALTAAGVVFTFVPPDGIQITPAVTTPSVGVYDCVLPALTQAGTWFLIIDVSGAIVDRVTDQFTVGNPAPPVYFDLWRFKLAIQGVDGAADTTRDVLMLDKLEAASRQVENTCGGRRFTMDAVPSTRVFPVTGRVYYDRRDRSYSLLLPDDVATLAGMVVEVGRGASWQAVTDYAVSPPDALAKLRPVTALVRYGVWWGMQDVRVTTRWGYPAKPAEVGEATFLQASRLWRRKDSPEGVTGTADWGPVRVARVDPDVEALLTDHIRRGAGG